ncbi:MAG: deoxyribonuclease IV [Verrucomicrobia bacterium]|nr:deoxyribonuclease IV [Verrucomicrobiota bacterium]MBV8486134.1 deoxyribonuclease IV [Verrucomicrobiota bacterium]
MPSLPKTPPPLAPLLGAHMSISGGPAKALERGHSVGCTAVQIFVKNNMQWFAKDFATAELEAFANSSYRPAIVFGHTSYLINLCATDPVTFERSRAALKAELERADQLGLPFLVLHPGAHMGAGIDTGLARIVESLDFVLASLPKGRCKVALEATAGQGSTIGSKFAELAVIIDRCRYPKRLSVCLDTSHLFAAGYDISTPKKFWNVFAQFEKEVGSTRLAAWHLNDSKAALGSRVDRHEHIGKGKIGLAPFREIMRSEQFSQIPKVLETPKGEDLAEDRVNLGVLRSLL